MSFYMDVEISNLTWGRARELAQRCSSNEGLSINKPRRGLFAGRDPKKLIISDRYGDDSILSDVADWDAPTWAMQSDGLARLEATLRCLFRLVPEGFSFVAGWVSDSIEHDVEVSRDELIELVRNSELNGRTRYSVRPTSSGAREPDARSFEDWEERLVAIFREAAQRQPGGRLDIGRGGPGDEALRVTLEPPSPRSAGISALLTDATEVDLTLGESLPIELWYKKTEQEQLLQDLRDWVSAVVEGCFEETVARRQGQVVKGRGKIVVAGKEMRLSYRSLPTSLILGRTQKTVHRYEPYS